MDLEYQSDPYSVTTHEDLLCEYASDVILEDILSCIYDFSYPLQYIIENLSPYEAITESATETLKDFCIKTNIPFKDSDPQQAIIDHYSIEQLWTVIIETHSIDNLELAISLQENYLSPYPMEWINNDDNTYVILNRSKYAEDFAELFPRLRRLSC